jgi:hypothetical protein
VSEQTQPTVGRIVHYVSYGTPAGEFKSQCRAAIVAGVPEWDEASPQPLELVVLNPTGLFFNRCPYSTSYAGGTWHWPERVE